jgi:acetyl-CoA decarbonylase/synthase complex subunit gamma
MHYTVDPGLYALGEPDAESPVLVTSNYKMSFVMRRRALPERNAWILVLDTLGINVWCAAGKGTFGTEELARRVESSELDKIVTNRQLILPQLAGPGIEAHRVKKLTGFEVIYGPIRAQDLPAFIDKGLKATSKMRLKTFPARERLALIPMELVPALKGTAAVLFILFLLSGLLGPGSFWGNILSHGLFTVPAILAALLTGTVLTPLLLPWLPGRAFSTKGLVIGLIGAAFIVLSREGSLASWAGRVEGLAWFFIIPAIAAYLAMNFTGSSTYTSLSGVRKEMRWAVPVEIGAGLAGLGLWLSSLFMA